MQQKMMKIPEGDGLDPGRVLPKQFALLRLQSTHMTILAITEYLSEIGP